jgi:hypothetical protein
MAMDRKRRDQLCQLQAVLCRTAPISQSASGLTESVIEDLEREGLIEAGYNPTESEGLRWHVEKLTAKGWRLAESDGRRLPEGFVGTPIASISDRIRQVLANRLWDLAKFASGVAVSPSVWTRSCNF